MPGGIRVLFVAELFYELFDAAYATVQQENAKRTALKEQFSLRGPSGETRTRGILGYAAGLRCPIKTSGLR